MTRGLNIAFFGSSLVSTFRNDTATYYRGIIRALYERGHRVTFYEPQVDERQRHRDIADLKWAKVVLYAATGTDGLHRVLESASDADVIIKASGIGVFDRNRQRTQFVHQRIADRFHQGLRGAIFFSRAWVGT